MPQQNCDANVAWVPSVAPMLPSLVNMSTAVVTLPTAVAVLPEASHAPASIGSSIMGPVEISQAVWSLYEDQVKPYGRILRKRLAEHASARGLGQVEVDPSVLRQACESFSWFRVQDESAGEWACYIPGMPEIFIDATEPTDLYAPELWASFNAYLDSLAQTEENAKLPGGRYACALELASRQLHFFTGYKLGQICHIVQLAISQKHYLGYSEGCLVPYALSQSMVKEQRATQQKPIATRGSRPLATWGKVREVIQHILLKAVMENAEAVPLANVKRIFRSQFRVELSETSLGYSKLSELLRDAFLSDLCIVELRQSGYVIIPRPKAFLSDACAGNGVGVPSNTASLSSEGHLANEYDSKIDQEVQNTTFGKSDSEPLKGRCRPQLMEDVTEDFKADSSIGHCPAVNPFGCLSMLSPSKISQEGCMGGMLQRTFIHHTPPPPTPAKGRGSGSCSSSRIRSSSVPKNFGSPKCAFADALHALVYLHRPVHSCPASEVDDASNKSDSPTIPSLTAIEVGPPPSA